MQRRLSTEEVERYGGKIAMIEVQRHSLTRSLLLALASLQSVRTKSEKEATGTDSGSRRQERRFTHWRGEGILSKPGGPVCPDRLLFLGCEDPLRSAPLVVGD